MHAVADLGFLYCTPIQSGIMPPTLEGRDAFGKAQTGTGKTAAFLITILTHMLRKPAPEGRPEASPRALILAPTRELALQIHKDAVSLGRHCPFHTVCVYGGMDFDKQRRELTSRPVDIVIATPGRLIDFKNRRALHLDRVEILVIDEADRMLDMGFIPDVRKIVHSTPPKDRRQTLFFSATLTDTVRRLADQWTRNAVNIEIEPEKVEVDTVTQVVFIVTTREKFALLYNILERENAQRVIVFANRRDEAERLMLYLRRYGINTTLLSGAVPQDRRLKRLEDFRSGKVRVLVATDVAGRGLHVESVSHVVNFNMPMDPEDYVHRIGRTGRAGATGTSISFACEEDSFQIPAIEAYLGHPLSCTHPDESWLKLPDLPAGAAYDVEPEVRVAMQGPRTSGRGRGGPRRPGSGHRR
jgi:ATP-dependent RNA helicase RhlB